MKRLALASVVVIFFASSIAFATTPTKSSAAVSMLRSYEDNAKLYAVGMCDESRSTIIILRGDGYMVTRFDPITDPSKQFYVVTMQRGRYWTFEDHFIKDLPRDTSAGEGRVRNVSHFDLFQEVGRLSENFYPYIRGSSIDPHDCSVSPVERE